MRKGIILHLGRPTPGDKDYYSRWDKFGKMRNPDNWLSEDEYSDVRVIVTDQYTDITTEFLDRFPHVSYVVSPTTGHTHLKFLPGPKEIMILTLKDEKFFLGEITSVAEYTVGRMCAMSQELGDYPVKMAKKNLAVIGYGRIGRQVTNICRAMQMHVNVFDKVNDRTDLYMLAQISDYISIHLEENEETRGIIDKRFIDYMRPEVRFINTARASVVDEEALKEFLINHPKALAYLDVTNMNTDIYPGNLYVSEHVAGRALEDRIATDKFMIGKLEKYLG